ncbi:ComEC/Rec2 family competence protein [Chryseobacterium carnipullorum]|uniref:ComEC/Rec2 family competence protein n=1 Tax=Chryseobacterium carnipullorum TaxID=1124835 RepID=UPI000E832E49|nr:ComEC/Rec2 family competence protein [Chryseobacterium carnipullorum]HBV16475.1 ComEC family competence protein [Chryseobacterium carnipullorum]
MSRQPILILATCFILGIFFQDQLKMNKNFVYPVSACCLLFFLLTFFHSYFLHKMKTVLLGLLFFGAGIILHFFNTYSSRDHSVPKKGVIVFKISKKLNSTVKNKKYEAVVRSEKENFNAVLYIPKAHEELDFKHYYKAEAYLSKPRAPEHDFQFDYSHYLKRKNIEYQCYVSKEISSTVRSDLNLNERIQQQRFEILKKIDSVSISAKTREFLKGIILADRTEMDAETVRDFNRSGLVHFLAISGTHIVVIFGMFYFLLTRFSPLRFRKYAVVASIALIWLFAALIGFGNSVTRSCIMLTAYFIYVILQRKPDLLHSLSLSAMIILVLDTQQIFDVGFQLSFLAVLGIFWLNQPLLRYFPRQDSYFKKLIFNTITISLSAQLATLPVVLYYFHQFSLVSFPANILIVPFSELIIIFSFLMTILIALQVDFTWINFIYDLSIQVLLKLIHWFAESDILFFSEIPMNIAEVLFLSFIVYLLRPLLLKVDFKNSVRLVTAVLVFLVMRTGFGIFENQKEEILLHDFNKTKVLSLKKGDSACFWIAENADKQKIITFIASPYCASRRIRSLEIKTFPHTVQKVVYNGKMYDLK